ncbi:M48 family metallopeptidase [Pusillimonas sp. CC-YST705]|uniref:M48 family metallopeptidase n=1 Tax=Mesopusillimonas faecipullorum TaxID=2755040 RepID=A0ABS8CBS3_9BURK|nr:M48 family metallopeptidase [Mesopusillimonas faecipullorum]MCB5363302.1 M48 family metallopeptidase [Mesopusillimonas faecipullorum]
MFTIWFIVFLAASLLTHAWLSLRQIRHVALHRNQVPAVFAERIRLASHQRAADYTHAKMQLSLAESFVSAALLIVFTLLGLLQWLDIRMAQIFDNELLRQMALVASVAVISSLVSLPFALWRRFKLDERFGFNRMTPALFISDALKSLLISIVLGAPLLALILWVMDNAGPAWAWWAWGIWVAFNLLILWLFPTVIAPLFNKFTPLEDSVVAERVQKLAQRCGFALNGIFVMDGSKRSAHGNAYFTGFGKARRIVFFDTLLNRLNADEIEAVLAHELGHFKHRHILKRMVATFLGALVFLQVLAWLSQQTWFYTGLGVMPQLGRSNSGMALVLFFLVVPVFTFWVSPLAAWFSRKDEFQADQYAASQAPATALVSALVKLYDDNAATLTPDPLYSAYHDSHPPAMIRIARLQQQLPVHGS